MKIELEDVVKLVQKYLDRCNSKLEYLRADVDDSRERDKENRIEKSLSTRSLLESVKISYNTLHTLSFLLHDMKKLGVTKEVITPLTEAESIATLINKD